MVYHSDYFGAYRQSIATELDKLNVRLDELAGELKALDAVAALPGASNILSRIAGLASEGGYRAVKRPPENRPVRYQHRPNGMRAVILAELQGAGQEGVTVKSLEAPCRAAGLRSNNTTYYPILHALVRERLVRHTGSRWVYIGTPAPVAMEVGVTA